MLSLHYFFQNSHCSFKGFLYFLYTFKDSIYMLIYHQYCRVENHSHICMQSGFHDQTKTFYIHMPGACMTIDFLVLGINQTKGYADCTVVNTCSTLTYFSVALLMENLRPVIGYCSGKTCNIQRNDLSTLFKPTLLNWLHNEWPIKTLDP